MDRVKIESLAYGGYGVGRIDRKVCFVRYGVPDDELLIEITSEKRGVSWASIHEVCSPSPNRREPACPVFEKCGGCQWLHIKEESQIEWKKKIVENAFTRIGKFDVPLMKVVNDGTKSLGYRTRAQFHFEFQDRSLRFGYHEPQSHGIVDIDRCPLLCDGINELIPEVKDVIKRFDSLKYMSSLRITINPSTDQALLWLDLSGDDRKQYKNMVNAFKLNEKTESIDYKDNPDGINAFELEFRDYTAIVPSNSFSQASFFHNQILIKTVMELAGDVSDRNIVDLYCGWGNLSLPLIAKGASIKGYDSDSDAILAANTSVGNSKFKNGEYYVLSDYQLSRRIAKEKDIDIIILDPPRVGAKEIVKSLGESSAKKIIYVSCDPNTLARDLKELIACGWVLKTSCLIDMIPQTYHIETVNLLEKL